MYDHLQESLTRRFGLGQTPEKRSRFFRQLQQTCEHFGEGAFRCIKVVAAEAASKNNQGNWFCAAVLRRLREAGYVAMDASLDPPKKAVAR